MKDLRSVLEIPPMGLTSALEQLQKMRSMYSGGRKPVSFEETRRQDVKDILVFSEVPSQATTRAWVRSAVEPRGMHIKRSRD